MARGPIRTIFATAAILCSAGLALSVVGYAAGGRPSQGLFWSGRRDAETAAMQAISPPVPMEALSEEGTQPQNGEYSLDVDLSAGDVTIEEGDAFAVKANAPQALSARWDGSTYQVRGWASEEYDWGDLEVTVTVPEGIVLQRAEISTGVGSVTAYALRARTVELSADTGSIEVDALWAEELECSASAGRIQVYDAQVDSAARLDADAGSIEANGAFSGRISAECDVGSILLNLEEPADYGYRAQGELGSIILGDREFGGMDFDHSEHADAATFFDLSSDVGSIEVYFS